MNTRKNGTFIQPRSLQHTNRVIRKELNMPLFDFHTLRHTHTTLLLEAGANPLDVQERLGHSHLAITWKYAITPTRSASRPTKSCQRYTNSLQCVFVHSFTPFSTRIWTKYGQTPLSAQKRNSLISERVPGKPVEKGSKTLTWRRSPQPQPRRR